MFSRIPNPKFLTNQIVLKKKITADNQTKLVFIGENLINIRKFGLGIGENMVQTSHKNSYE